MPLPVAHDKNGKPFSPGAIVRNTKTGQEFLVRGMYRQDEGPTQSAFENEVEVVSPRPDTMKEVQKRINESRDRGHAREGGAIRHNSAEEDGWTLVWGW